MGQKGAQASEAGAAATRALLTDLAELGAVTSRPMFGGHGVFLDGVMFALVDSAGSCFLRADPAAAAAFEAAGSMAGCPTGGSRQTCGPKRNAARMG